MIRRIKFNKYGITENPIGLQVSMRWMNGRTLLGDVIGFHADQFKGVVFLHVRHFNGEMWPVEPTALNVTVLE